eukprot:COSAG06_NODE_45088_length_357_cov_3.007752_1_plen_27_part_10
MTLHDIETDRLTKTGSDKCREAPVYEL